MGDDRRPKRSLAPAVEYLAARLGLTLVDAADITTQWAEDDKITIWIKVWDNKTRSWKYLKTKACEWSHQYISVGLPPLNGPAKYDVIEEVKGVGRSAYPDAVDFVIDWRKFECQVEEIAPVPIPPAPVHTVSAPDADESGATEESAANGETAPASASTENAPATAGSVESTVPKADAASTELLLPAGGSETAQSPPAADEVAAAPTLVHRFDEIDHMGGIHFCWDDL
jgi:hypothetical protein